MSRTRSAASFPESDRLVAWFSQMDFADAPQQNAPDWPWILSDMPFWAQHLLAVMISMDIIQVLVDDSNNEHQQQLIAEQLNLWRV